MDNKRKLGKSKVLTTPFADDFDLITNNLKKHQKLQLDVQKKAESMGLTFKPSKCRSLSLLSGKPQPVPFFLSDPINGMEVELKNLESDPHKFLGCVMTHNNTPKDHLEYLKDKLNTKLKNIEQTE